jgi:hypothetical protein
MNSSAFYRIFTIACVLWISTLAVPQVFASVSTDSLEAYWKFDEGSGTVAGDSSGENNTGALLGGMSSTGWITTVPSLDFTNPYSLEFDGADDAIYMYNPSFVGDSEGTISAWIYVHEYASERRAIFGKTGTGGFSYNANVVLNVLQDGTVRFRMYDSAITQLTALTSTTTLTLNTWYHILVKVDEATDLTQMYIDGTYEAQEAGAYWFSDIATPARPYFYIGGWDPSINEALIQTMDGLIDDVRVYSRALTGSEITSLAAGDYTTAKWDGSTSANWETAANWDISAVPDPFTHVIIPDTSTNDPQLTTSISGASLTIEASATLDAHGFNIEFTSGSIKGGGTLALLNTETLTGFTPSTTSTGTVMYYGTGSYTELVGGDDYYNLNINDGLVGYWKLDEGTGTTAADSSGHGHNGTLTNSPTWSSSTADAIGFTNPYALSFDGTNDMVTFSNVALGTGHTIAFWMQFNDSGDATIISGTNTSGYAAYVGGAGSSDSIYYNANEAGGGVIGIVHGGFTSGQWYHISIERSNGDVSFYKDGSQLGSAQAVGVSHFLTLAAFGAENGSELFPFDGLLDDVRIYDRALSNAEIARLATGQQPQTASGDYILDAALDLAGSLTLAAGDLDVSSSAFNINVDGSWLNYGGTFTAQSGSVIIDGTTGTIQSGGQSFETLSINDGLLGYWKFDEGIGTTAYDSSGYGKNGVLQGAASWSATPSTSLSFSNPYALDIDGTSGSRMYVATPAWNLGGSFTATIWVYVRTVETGSLKRLMHQYYGGSGNNWILNLEHNYCGVRAPVFEMEDGSWHGACANAYPTLNTWTHYTVRYDEASSQMAIFVDGVLNGTATSNALGVTNVPFRIGDIFYTGEAPNALIGDVRYYNRVLSATEISTLAGGANFTRNVGTYALADALDIEESLILASQSLDVSSSNYAVTASGSFVSYGGVFTPRSGTVTLDGIDDNFSTEGGAFYNLTINSSSGATVSGPTTVTNTITINSPLDVTASSITATTTTIDNNSIISESANIGIIHAATISSTAGTLGDTIAVTLTDSDENSDPNTIETVVLTLYGETLTLTETTVDSGIFTGSIATTCGTPVAGNNIIESENAEWHRLNVNFIDANDATDNVIAESAMENGSCGGTSISISGGGGGSTTRKVSNGTIQVDALSKRYVIDTIQPTIQLAIHAAAPVVFRDIPQGEWYTTAVNTLTQKGILSGYKDTEGNPLGIFRPAREISHAEALKLVLLVSDKPELQMQENLHWAAPYYEYAKKMNVPSLFRASQFDTPITRADCIALLIEVADLSHTSTQNSFNDVPSNHPHAEAISFAQQLGWINGDTDKDGNPLHRFRPDAELSRAEFSVILQRVLEKKGGGE